MIVSVSPYVRLPTLLHRSAKSATKLIFALDGDEMASLSRLDEHPFVSRLLHHVDLSRADLRSFENIVDSDLSVRRRHDFVVDGLKAQKLCLIKEGYAVRYRLLRNGRRQIVNVLMPGDVVGMLASIYERAAFSVTAITDVTINMCSLEAYVQLSYQRPQFALALCWMGIHEASMNAEHIVNLGRRTPVERLSHFLLEVHARLQIVGRADRDSFVLPFSQEVMADALGLSVPHLNKMMQQLRQERMIVEEDRHVSFTDMETIRTLAQYQLRKLSPIPQLEPA